MGDTMMDVISFTTPFFNNMGLVLFLIWVLVLLFFGFIMDEWIANVIALFFTIGLLLEDMNTYGIGFDLDKLVLVGIISVQFIFTVFRKRE